MLAVLMLLLLLAYFLYDTLRERSKEEKLAEIVHLEDQRDSSKRLYSYLEDSDAEVRERAAMAVGRIGTAEGAKRLFELISNDAAIDVTSTAAFAIGLSEQKEYAFKLLDAAFDYPGRVAANAVLSAGRLADSSMKNVHVSLQSYYSHPSPEVREAACMATFLCKADYLAPEMFKFFNFEPDEDVKITALYALARMGISQAENIYKSYLADADPFVRTIAVRGLSSSESDESTHLLSIAANDSDPGVAAEAITMLGKRKSEEAQKQLARKLERAEDPKIVVSLFNALRAQGNDRGIDVAHRIIETRQSTYIASAAVKYLAFVQKDRAVNIIDSLATVDDQYLKVACAEAYGMVGRSTVVPRLARLFVDPNSSVRMAAFNSLLDTDRGNYDYYMKEALADTDYVVVNNAVVKIGDDKQAQYLEQLLQMSDARDLNADIKRSLIELAGKFLRINPKDATAKQLLINGAIDPEYVVRRDAAGVYNNVLGENRSDIIRHPFTKISESKLESSFEKFKTNPYATIFTSRGQIDIELYFDIAPLTVLNFIELAKDGFYEGIRFHRVVPNFVAQGGDPRGDGWGGPNYYIRDEYSAEPYKRGAVGIATSGKDTGGSQFFITLSPQPHLEGRYTLFGQVIAGMQYVDELVIGDEIEKIEIQEQLK